MYSVAVAEDNAVVREVLRGIIRHDESLSLVAEARDGTAALELVALHKPDVICLDVMMPGLDGLSALKKIRQEHPDTRVIIVTGHPTSDVVQQALASGAHGFVVKPFNADKLLRAIHHALASR